MKLQIITAYSTAVITLIAASAMGTAKFYEELLKGTNVATALRNVQISIIKNSKWKHPQTGLLSKLLEVQIILLSHKSYEKRHHLIISAT